MKGRRALPAPNNFRPQPNGSETIAPSLLLLSKAELDNAPAAIRTLDANSDGNVTAEELRPARPANAPTRPAPPADAPPRNDADHPRPIDPVMLALDANGDGTLSAAEINNATASLSALDANKDGTLTRDEIHPVPPGR